ncbi:hypothetical protein [Salinispora arenicola]|uniref:hypothetical protein n=1 Tax=Salinispora arenicola TaxID=168697 RepID=UPI0027DE8113|nr:hypothetical protein [Salinispora arenicola]
MGRRRAAAGADRRGSGGAGRRRPDGGGRLRPAGTRLAVWSLLRLADVVLVLARGRADEVAHLREYLGELVDAGAGRVVVLLGAGGAYPAADVAQVLSTHLVEDLARDPQAGQRARPAAARPSRGRAVLGGELLAGRRWRHLSLMATYARLWTDLAPFLPTVASGTPADIALEATP